MIDVPVLVAALAGAVLVIAGILLAHDLVVHILL